MGVRLARWWRARDLVGLVGALAFFCWSLTPSLLPRGWLFQGLVSGILVASGYAVGVALRWIAQQLGWTRVPDPVVRFAWLVLALAGPVLAVVYLILGYGWQQDIRHLMDRSPQSRASVLGILLLSALVAITLVGLARALRRIVRRLGAWLSRFIPARAAGIVAGLLIGVVVVAFLNDVVLDSTFAVADGIFRRANNETQPDTRPPTDPRSSGSPASLVGWGSLGRYGRGFVSSGPDAAEIAAFTGTAAEQPIRTYVGLDSASSIGDRAGLAVAELARAGGFSRSVLAVVIPTGTGWVDPDIVDPLEYQHGGDTAVVSMQYSYLPSWLSFLADRSRARAAGRELFNRVYDRWSRLPERTRPTLLVAGESLGAFGAEAAFSGVADIKSRTDGMLLVGPPNASTLWQEFTGDRDAGSEERLPVYRGGETVRFAASPVGIPPPAAAGWADPRVLYLQHASDPIVWWSPELILNEPAWLEEPRGDDVLQDMDWYPLVTFWQVTADLTMATNAPAGHGHDYGADIVDAWAAIAPPKDWTAGDTGRLRAIVAHGDPTAATAR